MQIRPYLDSDWLRLCAIHDAARLDELRLAGLSDAFLSLADAADGEGLFDGQIVVAEVDGRVMGFVAFGDDELTWLYCDPAAYRQGVGRALLRHVLQQPGDEPLRAEVLVGNEPALRLYLSEGFAILQEVQGRLAGNEAFAASGYLLQHEKRSV